MDEQPTPQATKPAVKAAHVLGMNPGDVCNLHDLSGHPSLDYRVLSLMNPGDAVAFFHLT